MWTWTLLAELFGGGVLSREPRSEDRQQLVGHSSFYDSTTTPHRTQFERDLDCNEPAITFPLFTELSHLHYPTSRTAATMANDQLAAPFCNEFPHPRGKQFMLRFLLLVPVFCLLSPTHSKVLSMNLLRKIPRRQGPPDDGVRVRIPRRLY